jgi:ABC-2 type transport system permease protein
MNLFKKDNEKIEKNSSLLKYGGYASVMTAVVIIAVIIINLAVSSLNIQFDLTKNKLYSLSEDTITLLKDLDEDVSITSVYAEGSEISVVTEILKKYASYSDHVTYENVDPYTNPAFATKYAQNGDVVSIGSVVVETDEGYKIIAQDDLADVSVDSTTGQSYMQGIKLESVLTGAIRMLTSGETQNIYALTGHSEIAVSDDLSTEFSYSGFTVNTLDLITSGSVPDDCVMLIINGAVTDITSNELDAINAYLEKGGSLLMTTGITNEEMPNLNSLLANYGVEDNKVMIIEGNANYVYNNNPFYIIPKLNEENAITSTMVSNGTNVFMPFASSIDLSEAKRSTVTITTLAESSESSYGKDLRTMSGYEYTEGDPTGPFNIAVSIEDSATGAKLVVCGSETLLESEMNNIVNGGNYGFILNATDYLTGNENAARSKSLGADSYLQLTGAKAIVIMATCVIVIPVVILIVGIIVSLRRRNK